MPIAAHFPVIDNRRFEDILTEARSRIPRYTPEWTDLNDNDPGITLVQLFAWMTDLLLYRLGRVPELNYLKFLELIGIELLPAEPARVEITFPVVAAGPPTVIVRRRTQVSAQASDSPRPVVFETERALIAIAARLASVQVFDAFSFSDVTPQNDGRLGFQPFGSNAVLESALLLGFDAPGPFPETELDLTFFVADPGAASAFACHLLRQVPLSPARLAWEYWSGAEWRTLSLLKDDTLAFTRSGHVHLRTPASTLFPKAVIPSDVPAARFWIRARLESASYERVPSLLGVRTNTVPAVQAETILDEVLGGSDGSPGQEFTLANKPILADTLVLQVDEGSGFQTWQRVDDLSASRPNDQHYMLNRTTGTIRFGDGRHAAIPVANADNPGGSIVAREYRFGGGTRGNVPAGTASTLQVSIDGIDDAGVTNLFAAAGGREEESLAEAKLRAPRAIRSRCRAVTPEDFEELARQGANIRRAKALSLTHPRFPGVQVPGAITVIVVPDSDAPAPRPSEATLRSVCAFLNQARLLTTELYIVPPTYQRVRIETEVVAEDNADLGAVKSAIDQALLDYFHPLKGGEDGLGWPFGGDIFFSRVYQRVTVPGVQRIERLVIEVDGNPAPDCTNVPICDGVLLYSTEHDVRVNYAFLS